MSAELVCVGLSHHKTPVDLRERVSFTRERAQEALCALKERPDIDESFILSTCNRVELYAHGAHETATDVLTSFLSEFHAIPSLSLRPHLYSLTGFDAAQQFFRVASSLDSLVLGEAQILGQVKDAMTLAQKANALGPHLTLLLNHALVTAKRVRSETQIAHHSISISHIAVELIEQVFASIKGRKTLLIGAGTMAEVAARCLTQKGAELHIANRSFEHAKTLADALSASPHTMDELDALLCSADIIMSSTNARGHLISRAKVQATMRKRRYRPLFFVDIAVPRNIDPLVAKIDGAYLYNVDDFSQIAKQRIALRTEQGEQAQLILDEELRRFEMRCAERQVAPLIEKLTKQSQQIADEQVAQFLATFSSQLTAEQAEGVRLLAHRLVKKVLHQPIVEIKARSIL